MRHEQQNKVMLWVVIAVCIALAAGGFYCGLRLRGLRIDLFDSQREANILESQLRTTRTALEEAKTIALYLRESVDGLRAERDTLVQQFSIIRQSIGGLVIGVEQGDDIVRASLAVIDEIIEIIEYLEGIRIY